MDDEWGPYDYEEDSWDTEQWSGDGWQHPWTDIEEEYRYADDEESWSWKGRKSVQQWPQKAYQKGLPQNTYLVNMDYTCAEDAKHGDLKYTPSGWPRESSAERRNRDRIPATTCRTGGRHEELHC